MRKIILVVSLIFLCLINCKNNKKVKGNMDTKNDEVAKEKVVKENTVTPLDDAKDAVYIGPGLLGLVAGNSGERSLRFETPRDFHDLLDPSSGWPSKRDIILTMEAGEVRLLRVLPPNSLLIRRDYTPPLPEAARR